MKCFRYSKIFFLSLTCKAGFVVEMHWAKCGGLQGEGDTTGRRAGDGKQGG